VTQRVTVGRSGLGEPIHAPQQVGPGGVERVQRLRREFANHGGSWLFFGRFISGVRNITGLVAGGSAMPVTRFLPLSAAAALAWALINALEYYWFGQALAGADTWVQVLLIVIGLAWLLFSFRLLRRRALRRLRRAGETETETETETDPNSREGGSVSPGCPVRPEAPPATRGRRWARDS
jgi:hypothetical protein